MKIGFLGVGVITSAIVHGMCLNEDLSHEIFLSPRNKKNAGDLSRLYKNVTVCQSNQDVVDQGDFIILAVVPDIGETVIKPLDFSPHHHIINLMSDRKLSQIKSWVGVCKSLTQVVPLSFIAKRNGPIAIYPATIEVIKLFKPLGEVIAVSQVAQIQAMAAVTGLMTSYYKLLWEVVNWSEKSGLSKEEGIYYTASFFEALSSHAKEGDLESLSSQMTPGGFNEMVFKNIDKNLGFALWTKPLNLISDRLKNESYY